ncbi:MAG: hypothetical protein WEB30_16870 [Cyclobacteriaceae bacterium]
MKILKLYPSHLHHRLFVVLCLAATFWACCKEDFEEPIEEVEADYVYFEEATLKDVSYHEISYDRPTILVFPNLTAATNSVYFHKCVNIKEVQFPNLVSVGDIDSGNPYIYFHQNEGLQKVKAPKLTTVYGYAYFYGNSSLDLSTGICEIADIYPRGDPKDELHCSDASVTIVGNANNDRCFSAVVHLCD